MKEYIEREKLIDDILHALLVVPNEDFLLPPEKDIVRTIKSEPAADVRPVVLCRDCVYWQKPQVKLNDGTYRDYEPGEYENGSLLGGVTVDVGINIGSFCAKYNTEHQNRIPQFMDENDFCSKGYKLREES